MEKKKGERKFVDYTCSRRLSIVTCSEMKEKIYQRIRDNQIIRTDGITFEINTIQGSNWCKNGFRPNRNYL